MLKGRAEKALSKKAKKGFRGYPVATVTTYGPTDKRATKLVVGIIHADGEEPTAMKKWYADEDVMQEPEILAEVHHFIREHEALSVIMPDRILGCPHEEGIDYPDGEACPECAFWVGRNRFTGKIEH